MFYPQSGNSTIMQVKYDTSKIVFPIKLQQNPFKFSETNPLLTQQIL